MPVTRRDEQVLSRIQDALDDWGVLSGIERETGRLAPERHSAVMEILAPNLMRMADDDFVAALTQRLPPNELPVIQAAAALYMTNAGVLLDNIEAGLRTVTLGQNNEDVLVDYIVNFFPTSPGWYVNVPDLMQRIYALTHSTPIYERLTASLSSFSAVCLELDTMLAELETFIDNESILSTHIHNLVDYCVDNPSVLACPVIVARLEGIVEDNDAHPTIGDLRSFMSVILTRCTQAHLPPPILSNEPGFIFNGEPYPNYLQARRAQAAFRDGDERRPYFRVQPAAAVHVEINGPTLRAGMMQVFEDMMRTEFADGGEVQPRGFIMPSGSIAFGGGGGSRTSARRLGELMKASNGDLAVYVGGRTVDPIIPLIIPRLDTPDGLGAYLALLAQFNPDFAQQITVTDQDGKQTHYDFPGFVAQALKPVPSSMQPGLFKRLTDKAAAAAEQRKIRRLYAELMGRVVVVNEKADRAEPSALAVRDIYCRVVSGPELQVCFSDEDAGKKYGYMQVDFVRVVEGDELARLHVQHNPRRRLEIEE